MKKRKSIIWEVSDVEFVNMVLSSKTKKEVLEKFGLNPLITGHMYTLNARIEELSIDTSFMKKHRAEISRQQALKLKEKIPRIPLSEILVSESTYHRHNLKRRLIEEGILEEKCAKCGIGSEWQGEPLTLQLDHKNGINNDNRLENLRLLCPNCHSQTPTFSGKSSKRSEKRTCIKCGKERSKYSASGLCISCSNATPRTVRRKVERPSRKELIELVLTKPFLEIGKQYDVSDNAVRKWCKSEELPYRKKELQEKREKLLEEINQ